MNPLLYGLLSLSYILLRGYGCNELHLTNLPSFADILVASLGVNVHGFFHNGERVVRS